MDEFESYYPPKPVLVEKERRGSLAVTVFTLVLFILTFAWLLNDDYALIFMLVGVLLIHELGHFLMMKIFNYKNVRMLFVPLMGAFVHGKKDIYSQKERALVLLAGPIPGIVLGLTGVYYAYSNEIPWMLEFGFIFILINLMNLIPLDPLDGGQLLKNMFFGNFEIMQLVFSLLSSLAVIGFGWYMQEWIIVGFGFFLGLRVRNIQKLYTIRKELKEENLAYVSTYNELSNKDFAGIKSVVMENTPALKVYEEQAPQEKFNAIIASQVNGVLIAPTKKDAGFIFNLIVLILWLGAIAFSIYAAIDIFTSSTFIELFNGV